jgi:hypothetical protein
VRNLRPIWMTYDETVATCCDVRHCRLALGPARFLGRTADLRSEEGLTAYLGPGEPHLIRVADADPPSLSRSEGWRHITTGESDVPTCL